MATIVSLRGDQGQEKDCPDLASVPALLRTIAENIEAGDYGISEAKAQWGPDVVCRGALVLRVSGAEPVVFGLGVTSSCQTFEDFHIGAHTLLMMVSPGRS